MGNNVVTLGTHLATLVMREADMTKFFTTLIMLGLSIGLSHDSLSADRLISLDSFSDIRCNSEMAVAKIINVFNADVDNAHFRACLVKWQKCTTCVHSLTAW